MPSRQHHITRRRAARREGFTLVELMVALTIGGVALTAIYAVGSASSRHFREQQRVSSAQTALRMAVEQLKRDFARAGYLGSPNAALPAEVCSPPAGNAVAAFVDYVDNDPAPPQISLAAATENDDSGEVTFDRIVLMGNYSTSGEYVLGASSTAQALAVSRFRHSFRRDFTNWETNQYDDARFAEAFIPGRKVRVHTASERMHFANITGYTAGGATVDPIVNIDVPAACDVTGGWVSPLNAIAYRAEAAAQDDLERLSGARGDVNGPIAVLRRVEVSGTNYAQNLQANGVDVDSRSVLDYVIGFNLTFRTSGGAPTGIVWQPTNTTVNNTPQQLRSVIIDVAVRTPEQEQGMWHIAGAPLRSFVVFPRTGTGAVLTGAARVRTARAEVFLPNIAYRRL